MLSDYYLKKLQTKRRLRHTRKAGDKKPMDLPVIKTIDLARMNDLNYLRLVMIRNFDFFQYKK